MSSEPPRGPLITRHEQRQYWKGAAMNAPAKTHDIDPLLHTAQVAKLLGVSTSWLAKSRVNGTGPRFTKFGRAVRYTMSGVFRLIAQASLA
jgi:predicted DNA-binding transcriptional regulator AlpA